MSNDATYATSPWTPLGRMLVDYFEGDATAEAEIIWEDGARTPMPASSFFRGPADFPEAETAAVELCRGRVLDAGAGAGCHTLVLQELGLEVLALDVCPQAVDVMRRRGVRRARLGDVFDLADEPADGPFDTLLMLMNGIGLVGDLAGLGRFFDRAHRWLGPGGQIVLDSADVRQTDDFDELQRIVDRVRGGRYRGETRQAIEYRRCRGAPLDWLYLDPATLCSHAHRAGWFVQVVYQGPDGCYAARLVRR